MIFMLLLSLACGLASAQPKVKCKYEGNEFNPGQEAKLDCKSCFCLQSGEWVCNGQPCREGLQLIPSNDITLRNGSKIYLVCKTDVKVEWLTWYINGFRVKKHAVKISQSSDGWLATIGIDSKDLDSRVNQIECVVSPLLSRSARVRIINDAELPKGYPKIDANQRVVEASPGQKITLVCSAIGSPKPRISWFKFRAPVDITDARFQLTTESSLVISNVEPSDAGLYECMASNTVGAETSQHSIELVLNRDASLRVSGEFSVSDEAPKDGERLGGLLKLPPVACLFVNLNSKNGFYTSRAVTEFRENRFKYRTYQYTASFAQQPAAGVYSVNAILRLGRCPENETVATQLQVRDAISMNDDIDLEIFPENRVSKAKSLSLSHLDMVRIYKVAKTPLIDVTMEGEVIINSLSSTLGNLIPEGSCLKIAVIPFNDCKTEKSCSNTWIQTFDIKPAELGWRFPYRMELKKIMPGSYVSAALMQVAHCDADLSAFRLVNEKCISDTQLYFDILPDGTRIRQNMAMVFEEKLQTISGKIRFGPAVKVIPSKSCLIVSISEDINCHGIGDCGPIKSMIFTGLTLANSTLAYEIVLNETLPVGNYYVDAIVNFGWCAKSMKSSNRLRPGDYETTERNSILVSDTASSDFRLDLTAHLYTIPVSGKEVNILGAIELHPKVPSDISPSSCLIIQVQDVSKCNETAICKAPYFAQKRIVNPVINPRSAIAYNLTLNSLTGTNFSITAVLNVGWCQLFVKGNRQASSGDYHSIGLNVFEISPEQTAAVKDFSIHLFGERKDRNELTVSLTLSLSRKTSPLFYIPNNSCISFREASQRPLESVYLKNLTFTVDGATTVTFAIVPRPKSDTFTLEAVLNVGWCSDKLNSSRNIKHGDYSAEFTSSDFDGIVYLEEFKNKKSPMLIEGPATNRCKNQSCKFFSKCEIGSDGQPSCVCSSACPLIYKPVCGSDDKSYDNLCMMEFEACTKQEEITIKKEGKCTELAPGTILVRVALSTKNGSLEIPETSCLNLEFIDATFFDQTKLIESKIHRFERATKQDKFEAILAVNTADVFEITVSTVLHFKHCFSAIISGDFSGNVSFEIDEDQRIYDVAIVMSKYENPSAHPCDWVTCAFNGNCSAVGKVAHCRCPECPVIQRPVCASDGKTYSSACAMKRISCESHKELSVLFTGYCEEYFVIKGKLKSNATKQLNENCAIVRVDNPTDAMNFRIPNARYIVVVPKDLEDIIKRTRVLATTGNCPARLYEAPQEIINDYIIRNTTGNSSLKVYSFQEGCKSCLFNSVCKISGKKLICACIINCPDNSDPVCGSNGKTYKNLCIMKSENCAQQRNVQVVHLGKCDQDDCQHTSCLHGKCTHSINGTEVCKCMLTCPNISEFSICGSNGKTYKSDCERKRDSCLTKTPIDNAHIGPCEVSILGVNGMVFPEKISKTVDKQVSHLCLIAKFGSAKPLESSVTDINQFFQQLQKLLLSPFSFNFDLPKSMTSLTSMFSLLSRLETQSADSQIYELFRKLQNESLSIRDLDLLKSTLKFLADIVKSGRSKFGNCSGVEENEENYKKGYSFIPGIEGVHVVIYERKCTEKCTDHSKCHTFSNGTRKCICQLGCPRNLDPLCASDGKSYDNLCIMQRESCLQKAGLTLVHEGECDDPVEVSGLINAAGVASDLSAESCLIIEVRDTSLQDVESLSLASKTINLKTSSVSFPYKYTITSLKPESNAVQVTVSATLHVDHCSKSIKSGDFITDTMFPMNLTDRSRSSYNVDLTLVKYHPDRCPSKTCKFFSKCKIGIDGQPSCVCSPACPLIYKPVCGSDNKDYANLCLMQFEACTKQTDVTVKKEGPCNDLFPVDKPCRTELGDEVPEGHLIQYNGAGCPNCRCRDGQITCPAISCPDLPCIDGILQIREGDCCPTCVKRTCEVPESKKTLRIGESYFTRANDRTCKFCSCVIGGRFSCKVQICRIPTCKSPVKINSACCPVCPGKLRCKDQKTGALYKAGEKWSNGEMNGCSKCSCVAVSATKSAIECKKPNCPILKCQKTVYLQGSCCPTCYDKHPKGPMSNEVAVEFRKAELNLITTWTSSCFEPKSNNVYNEGESWIRGCQTFECSTSGIVAASIRCPLLACPKAEQIKKNNSCCAECRPTSTPVLFCDGTGLTLTVPKKYLPFAKPSQLIFDNSDCTATDNGTHLILRTDYQSCGTTSRTGNNSFIYRNLARTIEIPDTIISRVRLVQIPVVCTVPKKSKISFSKAFMPRFNLVTSSKLRKEAVLPDVLDVFMEVTTKGQQKLPDNVPAVVEVGEELFVDIRIAGNPAGDATVTAEKCYLTPTSERDNPIRHTLIRNGCPADRTVKFLPVESNGRRFSFKSLVFIKSKLSGFFLHCDTVTCNSRQKNSFCTKSCKNTRRARFAIRGKERFLSKFYLDAYISVAKK